MIAKIKRETQSQQAAADDGRSKPLRSAPTLPSYTSYLARIYGFEAPVEHAARASYELGQLIDLGWRSQGRLLKSDLAALGILDATTLPATIVLPFASVAEAFGWLYVVEQGAVLHGELRRHFERWLPQPVAGAGCYLLGGERASETWLGELGTALDKYATTSQLEMQVVDAARVAFRRQLLWFGQRLPPRVSNHAAS